MLLWQTNLCKLERIWRKTLLLKMSWYHGCVSLPAATKLGQGNVFTSVCLSTGGGRGVCLSACWDPPGPDTPPDQAFPPGIRHPPKPGTPPGSRPPQTRHRPPEADCSIRLTSGRYASYWNAFLYYLLPHEYHGLLSVLGRGIGRKGWEKCPQTLF